MRRLWVLVVLSACFNPHYERPACSETGECPGGLQCIVGYCESSSVDMATPVVVELLAGDTGSGSPIRFSSPKGVAVDNAGNVYVADTRSHTIRKVLPNEVGSTLAGIPNMPGSADGLGVNAQFKYPNDVAVDSAGNVYVVETDNHTIRKVTPAGIVSTLAGTASMFGSADGTGAVARFRGPESVAVDGAGNVYVADTDNHTIRKVTPAGTVSTLAGTASMPGSADGTGAAARFDSPSGVEVDSSGNVYVADTSNHTIRKVTPTGAVSTLAGTARTYGSADGTGAAARFDSPKGVAVDSAGNVYVTNSFNISKFAIRKITPAGIVTTLTGVLESSPYGYGGMTVDSAGTLYVTSNDTVLVVAPAGGVSTLASGSVDGTGAAARFLGPAGVAADSVGNIYIADGGTTIRKITLAGAVTTLAGAAGYYGSADGTGVLARFSGTSGVAIDSAGNIYVADTSNVIRKVTSAGVVSTLAGTAGMSGRADGIGAAARFYQPEGVAVDSAGDVYVADTRNCTLRKITPAGVVSTLAGTGGMCGSADGTGAAARFDQPGGIAVDNAGNVYVADTSNQTIRKVTPMGVVSTLAETARTASGVAVDSAGNVYVTDKSPNIRKITPTGITTTIGTVAGIHGIALASPRGLAIVGDALVVSDTKVVILLQHVVR